MNLYTCGNKVIRCFYLMLLVCFIAYPQTSEAKPRKANIDYSQMTLSQYVKSVCHKDCADSRVLLRTVQKVGKEKNVNFKLLLAIIRVESSFSTKVTNGNSVGIMQVNLKYHRKKFKVNPFNLIDNINVGSSIYKDCSIKYNNNTKRALKCYNGEFAPTYAYSDKVNKFYNEINQLIDLEEPSQTALVNQ